MMRADARCKHRQRKCRRFSALVSTARQAILDMIRHFLTNCRQLEMFLLDERIFGGFGKLSVMGCLVPAGSHPNPWVASFVIVPAALVSQDYPASAPGAIGL